MNPEYITYCKLQRLTKAATRFDCVETTGSYLPFDNEASPETGVFRAYITKTPSCFKRCGSRAADRTLKGRVKSISGIFTPDIDFPNLGYGDVYGTQDAILFIFNDEQTQVELFVFKGMHNMQQQLFIQLRNGTLNNLLDAVRKQARPTAAIAK
jgi:hypothetical protein